MKIGRDLAAALFCALLVTLCALLCCGNVEIAFLDDGPYTKTALDFARTGHFVYNGWAAAMLGVQALWGALWIKLFGFSFTIVRLSTVPLAAGCAMVMYAICRRDGLTPRLAVVGSLALMLAPVVIPHCLSFMTDIPALLPFLGTVYAMMRAREPLEQLAAASPQERATGRNWRDLGAWLVFATALAAAGGTVRQIVWLIPLLVLPYWIIRYRLIVRQPAVAALLALVWAINVATCLGSIAWFLHQPYAIREREDEAVKFLLHHFWHKDVVYTLAHNFWLVVLTIVWYSTPVLLPIVPSLWRVVRSTPTRKIPAVGITLCLLAFLMFRALGNKWRMPWLRASVGNLSFNAPVLVHVHDESFRIIPEWLRVGISLGVLLLTLLLAGAAIARLLASLEALREKQARLDFPALPPGTEVLTLFILAYLAGLMVKGFVPNAPFVWDRYIILTLPWTALLALSYYQRHCGELRGPFLGVAGAAVAIGAVFGVGLGHDYYAMLKATYAQTQALTQRGVARHDIMGGFEYDFWTQVTEVGYVNDERIKLPRRVYEKPAPLPFQTIYPLVGYTPIVDPRFVVVAERHDTLGPDVLPPQPYASWLTPFTQHYMYVQSVPGRSSAFTSAAPGAR